jgi:hypothetical protein
MLPLRFPSRFIVLSRIIMTRLSDFKLRDSDKFSSLAADISKDDADVTTALLDSRTSVGDPEVRHKLWTSRTRHYDADAIATQVCTDCRKWGSVRLLT